METTWKTYLLTGTADNAKLVCKLEDESLLLRMRVEIGEEDDEVDVECGELKSRVFLCCIDFDVELLLLFALAFIRFASFSDAKYGVNVLHTHRRYASCKYTQENKNRDKSQRTSGQHCLSCYH